MQNSFDSSTNTLNQVRRGAAQSVEGIVAGNEAATNVDNVAIFAKFMKKAEETAQATI